MRDGCPDSERSAVRDYEQPTYPRQSSAPFRARRVARLSHGRAAIFSDAGRPVPMSIILGDLRLGLRRLLKTPAASITVVTALSVGIGLCALMFSVIDGAILSTLPFENGDRIVRIARPDCFAGFHGHVSILGGAPAILRRAGYGRRRTDESRHRGPGDGARCHRRDHRAGVRRCCRWSPFSAARLRVGRRARRARRRSRQCRASGAPGSTRIRRSSAASSV